MICFSSSSRRKPVDSWLCLGAFVSKLYHQIPTKTGGIVQLCLPLCAGLADPDLPKAGSYGYTVSEEEMFEYDRPMVEQATDDFDLVLRNACRAALKKGLVSDPEDLLVVTAGLPFGTPGAANVSSSKHREVE